MTKNTIMGHIINLLSIAYADGSITEEEKNLICNISDNLGLTNEEFNHCLATWQETDEDILKVSMPEAEEDRIAFLKNMTLLMMIDGEIDENERQYISDAAELYGFNGEQAVNYLIKQIQEEYGGGGEAEEEEQEEEEEEDELFEGVDDENNIDSVWYDLESKNIEEAFDTIYVSALRNEVARNIFLVIPGIDTRLFRLTEEQIDLVKMTAEKGYPLAKYVLGRYYQVVRPEGSTIGDAGELLKAAADEGVADAFWALATMVEDGYYGPVNKENYDNLMGSALEGGSGMAIRKQLLDMVYGLHGMKANPKKAIDTILNKIYTSEINEKTYPYFYAVMGDAYKEMGNESKADECYEKAVDLGYFEASASRFVNKLSGANAEFNREMFNFFLDFGCDGKDPNCFLYRALEGIHFYDKKDAAQQQVLTEKIKEDLETAVDLGQGRAAFYLGYCNYYGKYGFAEDNNAAWQWFCKGIDLEDGYAYGGLAQMVDEGFCPQGLPEDFAATCRLNGLRRGNLSLLDKVLEAYRAGKLQDCADEIEKIYIPMTQQEDDNSAVSTLVVVNADGKALLCHVEKSEWNGVPALIGAKRLAPIRVNGLDEIGKRIGLTDRLTAWTDLEAPRKGLPVNAVSAQFYPGIIAGDIVFSLADNLYDPMPFYGTEEALALISALGADLVNPEVQELNVLVKERKPIQPTRSMLSNDGFIARVEPDCKTYILTCGKDFFKLFEEEMYDPARLDSLYAVGQRLTLPGRLTAWIDNTALRKQMVGMNTIKDNIVGNSFYPGKVADNIFIGMEDENFNMMTFSSAAQLKIALMALGIMPGDIMEVKD